MSQNEGKHEEPKFDFTPEGELLGYIGLDQARVQAIEHARDNTDFYGPSFAEVRLVWEVLSTEESDDDYDITLSLRPQGDSSGRPGQEQFFIEKEGGVAYRQVLALPRPGRRFPVIPVAIGLG
jgi:hypothetical protein